MSFVVFWQLHVVKFSINFCGVNHELVEYDMKPVSLVASINDMIRNMFKRLKFNDEHFMSKGIDLWSKEKMMLEIDTLFMDLLEMHLTKDIEDVNLEISLLPLALFHHQTILYQLPNMNQFKEAYFSLLKKPQKPKKGPLTSIKSTKYLNPYDVPISQLTQANKI